MLAARLTDPDDESALPEELHLPVVKLAAYEAAMPYATEGHQSARLQTFLAEALGPAREMGLTNRRERMAQNADAPGLTTSFIGV